MDEDDSPVKTHSPKKASDPAPTPPLAELGKKRESTQPSTVWDHFRRIDRDDSLDPDEPRFECNHCDEEFVCDTEKCWTFSLWAHLNERCEKYPYRFKVKKQKSVRFQHKEDVVEDDAQSEVSSNLLEGEVSKEAAREACARMMILDELPISFVQQQGFRGFWSVMVPKFEPPTSLTVVEDAMKIYSNQKSLLKSFLIRNCQGVNLTTEMWTSQVGLEYMCLTVHFIDSEWKLQKRILNFCQVPDHNRETIGKLIDDCLRGWGIKRVFTITIDNTKSNDEAINYVKEKLKNRNGTVLEGDFLHNQCAAQIVNLIVNEALRDLHDSIDSIRNAVRYVKSCSSRLEKFKACVKLERIKYEGVVVLDVPTRWNTTYKMLEAALKFQKVFERMKMEDNEYANYFLEDKDKKKGPPMFDDWENARVFVRILKSLYSVTVRCSDYLHITSDFDLHEFFLDELTEWSQSEDSHLANMASSMKKKCDKFWGPIENVNMLCLLSDVLDPRLKLEYLRWYFSERCDDSVAEEITKRVKDTLMRFYEYYSAHPSTSCIDGQPLNGVDAKKEEEEEEEEEEGGLQSLITARFQRYLKEVVHKEIKSEVDMYLSETKEVIGGNPDFNVLAWWKSNSYRFKILSQIARDVLAVPASTVSSASPFSTEAHILNLHWSCCGPNLLEGLVCAKNWIQTSHSPIQPENFMEDAKFFEQIESELLEACREVDNFSSD